MPLLTVVIYSQVATGKLAGKVTDELAGEPLIGANVVIVNTNLGSATDINGDYFILNITPGTYEVRISYVGYSTLTIRDVRIVGGITYELNPSLKSGVSLEEILISGKKFFEEKATNTVKVVDANDISRLPVKGVENIVSLQAGVVKSDGSGGADGNATLNVRGGRGGEVLYIVDGIPQNDIYTGANYSQVSNAAIEQISFQIGGYEAKYGQAQSGIINVTTKSGSPTYQVYADALSSSFTDDYGYNLYTGSISGPIIPSIPNHTFFFNAERGWFKDADPHYIGINFPSIGYSSKTIPNNGASVWRYTAKTNHSFGDFSLRLGANINKRDYRSIAQRNIFNAGGTSEMLKNNSEHNPLNKTSNYSFDVKISQNIAANTFWSLTAGYKLYNREFGDGVWFNDLEAYGDSAANASIGTNLVNGNGTFLTTDNIGIFYEKGRVYNLYTLTNAGAFTANFEMTSQLSKHLLEFGGGIDYNIVRYYAINPIDLASNDLRNKPVEEKYAICQPTNFGYDVTGKIKTSRGDKDAPKTPIQSYAYLQDRYELEDLVLNLGLRWDYIDTQADILKNPELPYAYGDPNIYDDADFVRKKPEYYFSPRIGLGFPVTSSTVFHAQYGKFVQMPSLQNLYSTIYDFNFLITDNNWLVNNGQVKSEVTTQYEIGFRQVIAEKAGLNVTAFYKNTKGLINTATIFFQRQTGGQLLRYITPTNTDFGTVKGLAITLDIRKLSYFSLSLDYTYSFAEGTGSSTNSSFVAAFRNINGEIPKVVAPLDFDQRHTGVINLDFYVPKNELGFLELTDLNILFSFASGRPYTPIESQNLIAGYSNYGDTRGYVNSANMPGTFRIDLKLEKGFQIDNLIITPYLWIENLLNSENIVNIYQSTGSPYTTGWLGTNEGKKVAANKANPQAFIDDYESYERNPFNFGIPRLIKLGLKVNFSNIQL
jgi:outer membrane receptor protein involved in Fe transport